MTKDHQSDHDHDIHDHGGHDHDHACSHGTGGHNHMPKDASDLRIILTVLLNVALTFAQLGIGMFAGSVALIADALHNTADAVALIIAYSARKIGRRPPDLRFTYGYQRVELVAAMVNLTALVVLSGFLIKESLTRLFNPEPVLAGWVMVASGVALVIDVATVVLLLSSAKDSLNIRAAMLHNISDAATSLAVFAGALAMHLGVGSWLDPLLGVLIAVYILVSAIVMLRRVAAVLMNNTPPHIDLAKLTESLLANDGVCGVHHLHVWQLDEQRNAISVHVVLTEDLNVGAAEVITEKLRQAIRVYNVDHITLQLEAPGQKCLDHAC